MAQAPTPYSVQILLALNSLRRHIYEGTVSEATIAKRRAKNKAACKARRANRG